MWDVTRNILIISVFLPVGLAVLAAEGVSVTTRPFAELAILPEYTAPATVVSINDSKLSSELTARIEAIPVQVGAQVATGDTLVELDCSDYEISQREAQAALMVEDAELKLAKMQLDRTEKLHDQGSVSEEGVDQTEADYAKVSAQHAGYKAKLAAANRRVEKCRILAPFPSIVTERLGQVGEIAMLGKPLVRILDREGLEVSADVLVGDIAVLRASDDLVFESDEKRYRIELRTIVAAIDPRARNQEVRFTFLGEPALPGATGRVVWHHTESHLPAGFVARRGKQLGVFLEQSGLAVFHQLPQAKQGKPVPVQLSPDARVIVEGRFGLRHGDQVRVTN
jgi:RND family efflux transporter MFP subunit